MNLRLLIDGIVRQTTVLIAQLSTASGARAPLAHVANQVFFELAREIESQGVKKQVVADMFGLAMRSYQKKMQRLTESASVHDRTLWEAVLDFIAQESPTRARVLDRFSHDGERDVIAVLSDLVRSGLIFSTGSADNATYGVTSEEVQKSVQRQCDQEALEHLVWLSVFRGETSQQSELALAFGVPADAIEDVLAQLAADGRVVEQDGQLRARNVVVPLGAEQGWETAILDHFRTVAVAIASKVRLGFKPSSQDDTIGGSTFTFTITPDHPHRDAVLSLLGRSRQAAQELWDQVAEHNSNHPPDPKLSTRVSFYAGQLVEDDASDPPTPEPDTR